MVRRGYYDPLRTVDESRWLKHYYDAPRKDGTREFSSQHIEPGTDLRKLLQAEEDRLRAEGWTIENEGAKGRFANFHYHRDGERRFVTITSAEIPLQNNG